MKKALGLGMGPKFGPKFSPTGMEEKA